MATHNRPVYNVVNATPAVIGRQLWSVKVQTYGWRHRKIVFYVLSNYWPQKPSRSSYFHLRKRRNRQRKVFLGSWKILKLDQIFRTVQCYEAPFRFYCCYCCCSVQCIEQLDPTLLCVSGDWLYLYQPCPTLRSQSTTALNRRVDSTSCVLFSTSTSTFVNHVPPCTQKSNTGKQFFFKVVTDYSLPVRHP